MYVFGLIAARDRCPLIGLASIQQLLCIRKERQQTDFLSFLGGLGLYNSSMIWGPAPGGCRGLFRGDVWTSYVREFSLSLLTTLK